jgi:hypothetical protein
MGGACGTHGREEIHIFMGFGVKALIPARKNSAGITKLLLFHFFYCSGIASLYEKCVFFYRLDQVLPICGLRSTCGPR